MSIHSLCENNNWDYSELMNSVEEFVDDLYEDATPELYQATAKRLLGESLNHDEIMLGVPNVTPDDLIVLEDASYHGSEVKFNITTDTQIRIMLTRLKLGRKGLKALLQTYNELSATNKNKTPTYLMAKAGHIHGVPDREAQIILSKMLQKQSIKMEYYFQIADDVLTEETPVNTSSSVNPDHEPTDGKPCNRDIKRRKKLSEIDV